jgi:L-alanine-DL-glutamate epimerase-like enolase superfamily enzyme
MQSPPPCLPEETSGTAQAAEQDVTSEYLTLMFHYDHNITAISNMKELARFKPWFIEEPTSPDDILGHATIRKALEDTPYGAIGVATCEMCQNRVMFKQFLQAGALTVLQADACRLGGVNEVPEQVD